MSAKKETPKKVKEKLNNYVKTKGYRLPHGYEVVVRKKKGK